MLYKEVIERKKLPVGTFLMFLLCVFLYLSKITSMLFIGKSSDIDNILDWALLATMLIIAGLEIYKASVRYKYSIIADQLIIHKIIRNSNVEVENIKIKDIEFVGRVRDMKSQFKVVATKKYTCSILNPNKCCCVYYEGKELKKFYFEASKEMISKLRLMMNKEEECEYLIDKLKISV